jgi:glycosyltransferase involved in cell wall biosynthesis
LKALASELEGRGIEVRWTGHVARAALPAVLGRADINVVPSRWDEPFGMVTLEGMACGLATVATRTGGTPEVCDEAALLFERDDASTLAAHLRALLENNALRAEYSRRGRERALLFSWERTWQTLWRLVNKPA